MKAVPIALALLALIFTQPAVAQDLAGRWSGVSGNETRALIVTKAPDGRLSGEFYFLGGGDISPQMVPFIAVQGKKVRFSLDLLPGFFDGEISADGKTIAGAWRMSGAPQPLIFTRVGDKAPFVLDPTAHKTHLVPVARDVALEVVDWGGDGPAIIFLPGFGNTAHAFDAFAPKLTDSYHVYGITRRGFGRSSIPPFTDANYDAERLAADVVAVMDALKLERAVLAGHSLGGSELSTVSANYPDRVSALVYLDAAFWYAFYAPESGESWMAEAAALRRNLNALMQSGGTRAQKFDLMDRVRQNFERMKKAYDLVLPRFADTNNPEPTPIRTKRDDLKDTLLLNVRMHPQINSPALIMFALPEHCTDECDSPAAKGAAEDRRNQVAAVEARVKNARVVKIPDAGHDIFRTHETEVLSEMRAFLKETLK